MPAQTDFLVQRQSIVDAVHAWSTAIDTRDWVALRGLLTDPVYIDYSSMGGDARNMASDAWIARLQVLGGFDATLHVTTNHVIQVDGHKASCRCYVHAYHFLNDGDREYCAHACGTYEHGLVHRASGWHIDGVRFVLAGYPDGKASFESAFRRARSRAS